MSLSNNFQSTCTSKTCSDEPSTVKHTTVLILGGGMAGVAAAYTLQSQGLQDFLLLEASGRLGGRISNTKFCGHTIEEGANWIHGVDNGNNPILRLARECGLKSFYVNEDSISARNSEGQDVTDDVKSAMVTLKNAKAQTCQKALARGVAGGEPPVGELSADGPLPDCSVSAAARALAGWQANSPVQLAAEFFMCDRADGLPVHEVSLSMPIHYKTRVMYGGGNELVVDPDGYSKLVRHLAAQTFVGGERDPRLLLHETVRQVHLYAPKLEQQNPDECLPDCCSSSSPLLNERESVYVRTAEGHEYIARYCIITFSNAVLLSGNVRFIPRLPEWKQRALGQCKLGACTKVFVKFADDVRPFWDASQTILYADSEVVNASDATATAPTPLSPCISGIGGTTETRSDNSDQYVLLRGSSGAMRYALDRRDRFTRGYYTVWKNLSLEGLLPGSNIILIMLLDEMAKSTELKSDKELKAEITSVLSRMYGKEVPEPEAIHCTKWHNNPLALGAYHCLRYGCTHSDLENLSRPVNSLHFAGDGTSIEYIGCVHAAYNTGVQQALAVFEKMRLETASREFN